MFISKTNDISQVSPIITTGVGSDLPSNIVSPDFSLNYTAGSNLTIMRLGATFGTGYVAVSAFNASQITIFDNGSQILDVILTRDNVVMFSFQPRDFADLRVRVIGRNGTRPTINNVSAGQVLFIPNGGESAGYKRNALTRNVKTRTTASNIGAPVASLKQRMSLKGNLNLPNMRTDFVKGEWQDTLDFLASGDVFYISEQQDFNDTDYISAYACYSPMFQAPSAHPDTRALNNIRLGFECYNGL